MAMLDIPVKTDYEALLRNLRREGTPERVFHMELFLNQDHRVMITGRFGAAGGYDLEDPIQARQFDIEAQRFLGYDFVRANVENFVFPLERLESEDTAPEETRKESRSWMNEQSGPITTWEEFERYPWPDPAKIETEAMEWYEANLPDDMCIIPHTNNIFEYVTWLMGYQPLCYAMFDAPDLVDAMFQRSGSLQYEVVKRLCQFDRVKCILGSDDMGFRGGTMIDPQTLIDKALPWHAKGAAAAHEAGKLYLLHSCGNIEDIMPAIIDDCHIDARHSYEETHTPVTEFKKKWGDRISVVGGIDIDTLCRLDEPALRKYVRGVLDVCMPGGGYCLGSGNSIANYVPVENYMIMLDEGRKWGR